MLPHQLLRPRRQASEGPGRQLPACSEARRLLLAAACSEARRLLLVAAACSEARRLLAAFSEARRLLLARGRQGRGRKAALTSV